jgi:hypothetical protein
MENLFSDSYSLAILLAEIFCCTYDVMTCITFRLRAFYNFL